MSFWQVVLAVLFGNIIYGILCLLFLEPKEDDDDHLCT